ncbi:Recombination, repair and ssDNA binding protein UvsY [uncultured Caudovirales phage]|uniref:Recombination, repair and ssDNA binding protein UvsY n=1 Tax=uncultured Caudovirales phage TaxID=2100421 RepID=A0A6J5KT89_9CAUD|nr:Recombination, repair and ssDNA binding protein UvsY [uncultured Caudovirales phage]
MKPTPLVDLIAMWDKDAEIDQTDPGGEILRIPILHSKYVKQHMTHSLASKQFAIEYSRIKKIKWEYYTGKLNGDEETLKKFNLEPFRFTLKGDISFYLESDEDLARITAKKALHDQAVDFCSQVVKELNARTYQIRAFMDWEKFIQGQR